MVSNFYLNVHFRTPGHRNGQSLLVIFFKTWRNIKILRENEKRYKINSNHVAFVYKFISLVIVLLSKKNKTNIIFQNISEKYEKSCLPPEDSGQFWRVEDAPPPQNPKEK